MLDSHSAKSFENKIVNHIFENCEIVFNQIFNPNIDMAIFWISTN